MATPSRVGMEAGRAFLATVLSCPVAITDDLTEFLPWFESTYCFIPALQRSLTATYLTALAPTLEENHVRELVEPLGTAIAVMRLDALLVVIGPYTHRALQPAEAESLLGRLGIPSARLPDFTLYRARFAIADPEYVVRGATALLGATGRDAAGVTSDQVLVNSDSAPSGGSQPIHSAPLDEIEARYATEREFIRAVSEGNERRALAHLQKMQEAPSRPKYFSTPYVGATAMRIMTRIAAQQGGLPSVSVDAISQTYAQRLHRDGFSPDTTRTTQALRAMVTDFCRAVRRYQQRPYSGLVRHVIDEVELHLSDTISPGDLARQFGISESQLARRFKAETGQTITAHVTGERVRLAARLLTTTIQPVQDIAAYVGYPDANYFVKVFRSVHGETPTQYRRARTP